MPWSSVMGMLGLGDLEGEEGLFSEVWGLLTKGEEIAMFLMGRSAQSPAEV